MNHATSIIADTIIYLNVQPLAQNGFPYLCHYNHNLFLLLSGSHEDVWSSGFPNYNKMLQPWQDESRRYRETIIPARNNDHDWLRRYSADYSYFWVAAHCCLQICRNLLQLPLYSSHVLIHWDRVLWKWWNGWRSTSVMNVHPSSGMFMPLHLYSLYLELSL